MNPVKKTAAAINKKAQSFVNKHPRLSNAITYGSLILSAGIGGWLVRDYQLYFNPIIAPAWDIQGRNAAVGKYMLEDLAHDWEDNRKALNDAGQSKSQLKVSPPLFNRIDKTANETGQLTIVMYNVNGHNHSKESIEAYMDRAFASLGIDINIIYLEIGRSAPSDSKMNEFESLILKNAMGSYLEKPVLTSTGSYTYDLPTALSDKLEQIVGKDKFIHVRDARTVAGESQNADIVIVLADFKDSKAAGVAINHSYSGTDSYVLMDSSTIGGDAWLAGTASHEAGHKLGLPHSDFPLDIMSYAPRARWLILQYPELAFGAESQLEWSNIKSKLAKEMESAQKTRVTLSSSTACAGTPAYVVAEEFQVGSRIEVAITNLETGQKTLASGQKMVVYSGVIKQTSIALVDHVWQGKNKITVATYDPSQNVQIEERLLTGVDCKGKLEQLMASDNPSGKLANLEISGQIRTGAEYPVAIVPKLGSYEFVMIVLNNRGERIASWIGSGGSPGTHSPQVQIKEPGLYRAFVAVRAGQEAELLTKTFEAK